MIAERDPGVVDIKNEQGFAMFCGFRVASGDLCGK